ncbi:MAG TPA: glycosyltransferase family 39 protein [Solirubrobacteraceae bacterium]
MPSPVARQPPQWEAVRPSAATFWPWLLGITVTAFLLRILYMLTIAPPLFGLADEAFYYHASDLIVQGHGYSQPLIAVFYGLYRPTALHPPLWSAVLSIVSLFTAPANDTASVTGTAVDVHRGVTCLCGATVVLLVGLLGRRIGGWRVGLVGAAIAALYPHFITLDGDLLSEPLYGAIVGGLVLLSYRFVDRPTRGRAFVLGVFVALAALTRAEGLWFIPVLLIPLAWRAGRDRLRLSLFAVLGALVLLVPWTIRNYAAFHRFVPVANSGAVIAGANNPCTYYGSHIGSWQGDCAKVPGETNLSSEIYVSSKQTSQGIDYARDHAGRAVLVAGARLLRVWSLYDPNYEAIGEPTMLDVGLWVYYVMLVAAVYGLIALRRRGRRILILIAPAIVTSIAAILGDGPDRLRYDAEVPLIAVAAWSFVLLFGRARRAWGGRGSAGADRPFSPSNGTC